MRWLSELPYGSFLVYPPRPETRDHRIWKNFIIYLKEDRVWRGQPLSRVLAEMLLRKSTIAAELHSLLRDAVLVPVPRSAPLQPGALWAPLRISKALREVGLGQEVAPIIERVTAVQQSHSAAGSNRPWPDQHRDSIEVARDLPLGFDGQIVLVDDVVTRGSTLIGCKLGVEAAYPDASVAAFAVARTLKADDEPPEEIFDPVMGRIRWRHGWVEREP